MISLANDTLEVQFLDPVADRARFGVRYCTGGYIFQVRDGKLGDLLSGPTFPASFNWFDGQGIPDAFNLGPIHSTQTLNEGLIIGIGVCDLKERVVKTFCDWQIERTASRITFATQQNYEGCALELVRTVELMGRTIRSHTILTNRGRSTTPGVGFVHVRWFPHPFYPQTRDEELVWVNAPLNWRDGGGYRRLANGFLARDASPWTDGHYLPLDHAATEPLILLQRHPALGMVTATCSYVPDYFPIWGNPNTFSWEPFLERTVAQGKTLAWWIDYTF
jgi:hypothetical protein